MKDFRVFVIKDCFTTKSFISFTREINLDFPDVDVHNKKSVYRLVKKNSMKLLLWGNRYRIRSKHENMVLACMKEKIEADIYCDKE